MPKVDLYIIYDYTVSLDLLSVLISLVLADPFSGVALID